MNNDISTFSKINQTRNSNFVNYSLDKKEDILGLQNINNPYLLNEASNFAPLGGNLTNLFYDNDSMKMFQNNNYNSNIFNNDNLFHSNNFNSIFIKNNNEDSMMVNKKTYTNTNDKLKSNISPFACLNNSNLIEKEKMNQKFNPPEIINHPNLNKNNQMNSSNSLIDINNSNKKPDSKKALKKNIKNDYPLNEQVKLTNKKTKRSKMDDDETAANLNRIDSINKDLINEKLDQDNIQKQLNKELDLSESNYNTSSYKKNKKSTNGKTSVSEKKLNKQFKRNDPIKLDELLNETEKNLNYSISKNLDKKIDNKNIKISDLEDSNISHTNFINNNFNPKLHFNPVQQNNIINLDKKGKLMNNINQNLNNNKNLNASKKSWIINQNNYFNNYNSGATDARFFNSFLNIDIPDPSGFLGKRSKGFNSNVGFVNPQFWPISQLGTTPFINPAYMQLQKIPMMYVPTNYIVGEYDFPLNVPIMSANPISGQLPINEINCCNTDNENNIKIDPVTNIEQPQIGDNLINMRRDVENRDLNYLGNETKIRKNEKNKYNF